MFAVHSTCSNYTFAKITKSITYRLEKALARTEGEDPQLVQTNERRGVVDDGIEHLCNAVPVEFALQTTAPRGVNKLHTEA